MEAHIQWVEYLHLYVLALFVWWKYFASQKNNVAVMCDACKDIRRNGCRLLNWIQEGKNLNMGAKKYVTPEEHFTTCRQMEVQ